MQTNEVLQKVEKPAAIAILTQHLALLQNILKLL